MYRIKRIQSTTYIYRHTVYIYIYIDTHIYIYIYIIISLVDLYSGNWMKGKSNKGLPYVGVISTIKRSLKANLVTQEKASESLETPEGGAAKEAVKDCEFLCGSGSRLGVQRITKCQTNWWFQNVSDIFFNKIIYL